MAVQPIERSASTQRAEKGLEIARQLTQALRLTSLRLSNYLALSGHPDFDSAFADKFTKQQGEYLRMLLELRKMEVPIDLQVVVRQGQNEDPKPHPFSRNLVVVTINSAVPREAFKIKTRLSEIAAGKDKSAEAFDLLGEKTIQLEDAPTFLWRTMDELYAIRQQLKQEQERKQNYDPQKVFGLNTLEYQLIRDRILQPEALQQTPFGARIDYSIETSRKGARNPLVGISVEQVHKGKKRDRRLLVLSTMFTADPQGLGILHAIDKTRNRSPRLK